MKNIILLILILLCISSCRDRDQDPNILPNTSQSGTNTAGALVDGKVWVASKKYNSETFAEVNSNNYTLITIYLKNISNSSRISIKASIKDFELNKTYILYIIFQETDKIFHT